MRYRVDVSGFRRVQATVEVEADNLPEAARAARAAARLLAPFVWEIDEHDEWVQSIAVDHVSACEKENSEEN